VKGNNTSRYTPPPTPYSLNNTSLIVRVKQSKIVGTADPDSKGICLFETSGTVHPSQQHHISEDLNLQLNLFFWLYCRKVNKTPSPELLKTEEWRYGITLLEWVQSKKKLRSTHLLLSPLFSLLNK
jgi:hypothetical protein